MTNTDYLYIRKTIIAVVIGVVASAILTATAFYFSTTNTLVNINQRLDKQELDLLEKIDRREFERFIFHCDKREAAIERKFESIDAKLDWLIKNR
jgi:chorismate synthase